jgi:hypothetical protein
LPLLVIVCAVLAFAVSGHPATLDVGPGQTFARIEDANTSAKPGDVILVHPLPNGKPYEKTAVFVRQKNVTFRAATVRDAEKGTGRHTARVKISGKGFDYSGRGSTPRAIFQFNPGTDDCLLEGFDLSGAHNASHNGAGVRINQANHVTIRNCNIHDNDMGIMSGGDAKAGMGINQRIEFCTIHHNGDLSHPGYNHNLYVGGTSVTLSHCEVHSSLAGHNVKSRAHHTRVQYSYIHHSANREFDLVDSNNTALPNSHAVLMGNVVVKDPKCKGNRAVVHFGQDIGGQRNGTAYLLYNTIVTPFISPVLELSSPNAKAHLVGNLVSDGGTRQGGQKIAAARNGAQLHNVTGTYNWLSGGFPGTGDTRLDPKTNLVKRIGVPTFIAPSDHNYRLTRQVAKMARTRLGAKDIQVPPVPGAAPSENEPALAWQYHHPADREARPKEKTLTLGAYAQ